MQTKESSFSFPTAGCHCGGAICPGCREKGESFKRQLEFVAQRTDELFLRFLKNYQEKVRADKETFPH